MAALLTSAAVMLSACPAVSFAAMDTGEFESGYSYSTEMRGLSAFQIANDMGAGWNLGNSLEAEGSETGWSNPATTKSMIDAIAAKGFTTLRVPVRWDDNYSDPSSYTIAESYMDRVETVVNYGLANDMYVIINVHHNDLQTNVPNTAAISAELEAIWTQVGNRFKNYGDKLIFEVNNEPRCGDDWTGNASYYQSVNECNEAARAAIRATGGNNASRLVMLPTYCASGDEAKAAAWTKNSSDSMIAASIHAYLPFDFAFNGTGHTTWLDSDAAELEAFFSRLDTYFLSKGIPVVIGEFGCCNKNNDAARVKCADTYTSLARRFAQQNIPCIVWDNNAYGTGEENFGLFNRSNSTFVYGDIAAAIVNSYSGDPDYEMAIHSENVISSEKCTSSGWKQAITIAADLIKTMGTDSNLYAKYISSNPPELILQSDTNSAKGWVKVNPDSTEDGLAVWSYNTIFTAFGNSFDGLSRAFIGDTGADLTLTKVYIKNSNPHTHVYGGEQVTTLAATSTTYGRTIVYCSEDGCDAYRIVETDMLPACNHTGGEATCSKLAKCTKCFREYGTFDADNHKNVAEEWSSDDKNHWHKCSDCNGAVDKAAHVSGGAATESSAEICTVCKYVITPVVDDTKPASTIQEIIDAAVTDGMSDTEKAKAITKYIAENYSYNGSYQRYTDILTNGGGDCWANSELVYKVLEALNIKCIFRDASNDAGSGAGHINVVAYADGKYLFCDAGFSGNAPRSYSCTDMGTSPFSHNNGVITGYHGFETAVTIPSDINGTKITSIGSDAFNTIQLTIYSSINSKQMFNYYGWSFSHAETVSIPESVTSIESGAFRYSTLTSVTLPESITVINPNTFDYSENLKTAVIPASVKTICSAFNICKSLESVTIRSKDCVFDNSNGTVIPSSVTICGYADSTAEAYAAENGNRFEYLDGGHKHNYSENWMKNDTSHWKECSLCGNKKEETAHTNDGGVITTPPTANTEGEKTYSCTVCGYVIKTETVSKLDAVVTVSDGKKTENFLDLTSALKAYSSSTADLTFTLNEDVTVISAPLPRKAASVTITGSGSMTISSSSIPINTDTTFDTDIICTNSKKLSLKIAAKKALTINGEITNLGMINGTTTSVLNVNSSISPTSVATLKELTVADGAVLTLGTKMMSILSFDGTVKLSDVKSASTITTVGKASFIVKDTNGKLPKITVNNVTDSLEFTVVDDNGNTIKLANGTTVLYTAGKTDYTGKVKVVNQNEKGLKLDVFPYAREIRAEYANIATLFDGTERRNYPNLNLALNAIKDSAKDYTLTINEDITVKTLKLPKTANSLTINGKGTLSINSTSVAVPLNLTIDAKLAGIASRPSALKLSAGKALTINTPVTNLGNLSGTKTSILNIGTDLSSTGISNFMEINIADGAVLSSTGKVAGVVTLNGKLKLAAKAASAVFAAGKAEIILVNNDFAKATVSGVNESLTVTVVDENGNNAGLASGTVILTSSSKTDFTDKVTITNKTADGLTLDPFLYQKEVKAEYAGAITMNGENYPNLTKTFEDITDVSKDYVITLNSDLSEAKLAVPAKAKSVTLTSSSGTKTISLTNATTVTAASPLTINNVRIESTKPYTLNASKALFLSNFKSDSIKALKGVAKFALDLGETSAIPSITGFGTINVNTDFAIGTAFTTTTLNLGESKGIVIPSTKSNVSAKYLNGGAGSYIKLEQGFTPMKLTSVSNANITGTIDLVSDTPVSPETPIFASKYAGNGVFTTDRAVTASGNGHAVSIINGKAYIKPVILDLNGNLFASWADVNAAIESAEAPTDYTVTLLDDYDAAGSLKLPKAGTYTSLTVTSANKTLSFTGSITATGNLTVKNTALDCAKNGVSAKYSISASKYSFTAENADLNLVSSISSTAAVTLKNATVNGTLKAKDLSIDGCRVTGTVTATNALNLSGTNTILNTVQCASLSGEAAGTKLELLEGKQLKATKYGIDANSGIITLRLINAEGNAVAAKAGTIISSSFIGSTEKLVLDAANGNFIILSNEKKQLVLIDPAQNIDAQLDASLADDTSVEDEASEDDTADDKNEEDALPDDNEEEIIPDDETEDETTPDEETEETENEDDTQNEEPSDDSSEDEASPENGAEDNETAENQDEASSENEEDDSNPSENEADSEAESSTASEETPDAA